MHAPASSSRTSVYFALVTGLIIGAHHAAPAAAQTEVGVDLLFQVTNFSDSDAFIPIDDVSTLSLPASHIRAGFFVTPQVSVEPRVGVVRRSSGGESSSSAQVLVSGYYHFPEMAGERAAFLRTGLGASILSGNSTSDTQLLLEAGVGLKFPLRNQLLMRAEAFAGRSFESDASRAATRLGLALGVSWFSGA